MRWLINTNFSDYMQIQKIGKVKKFHNTSLSSSCRIVKKQKGISDAPLTKIGLSIPISVLAMDDQNASALLS